MTAEKPPKTGAAPAPKPDALPLGGGSYLRLSDGTLVPNNGQPPKVTPTETTTAKPE
jgi:hypothetical protein